MSNIRELSQLASVIHVNDETKNVGIGTTAPEAKLSVGGNVVASGNVTADAFYGDGSNLQGVVSGVGIQSGGIVVGTGVTTLNFVGTGNTFTINGNTVDISISGGGGGASVSIGTEAPANSSSGDLWYSSIYGRTFIYYEDDDSSQWVDAAPFNSKNTDNLNVINDNSTDQFFHPLLTEVTSGIITATTISSTKLKFNPSKGTLNVTELVTTSDINLKTNIKPIDDPLTKVIQLNGVSFDWKETQQPSMGVIAQELEKVFPELVKQSDSHKSVNYNGLIGVLIEAIKEQQKQIEELKLLNKKEKN
jgi:hypothetical protein